MAHLQAYDRLSTDLVEEGRFKKKFDKFPASLQAQLVDYCEEHGAAASKARSQLVVKITLQKIEPSKAGNENRAYSIKTEFELKPPKPMPHVTLALAERDEEGTPLLAVRKSGSDESDPRQKKLCTDDGRAIDQTTGKAIDHPTNPKKKD